MSDQKALLAAIWEHPHEDTPRLVYADWLQETEKPANVARAEFIRVQCALTKLAPWDDDPQRAALKAREAELWATSEKAFRRGLAPRLRKDPFRRGFVDPRRRNIGFVKQFLKLTDAQFAEAPLWDYDLSASETELPQLLAFRGLKRVGKLRLIAGVRRTTVAEQLARCENLVNLAALEWEFPFADAAGVRTFGAVQNVPHLTRFKFGGVDLREDGATAFGESRLAEQLTELSIRSNKLTPEAAEALFAPAKFRRLASLELGYEDKGDGIVAALTTGTRLPSLRHLRLLWMNMTAAGAKVLAEWPGAASLRHLEVLWSRIGPSGLRHLVRSPYLRNLLALDVTNYAPDHTAITKLLRERFDTVGPAPGDAQYTIRGGRLPDEPEPAQKPHAYKKRK